jgi:hypothetical protein
MTEQPKLIFTLRRENGVCCESTLNSRLFSSKSLRFTHFPKNASATPLESHSFKTKDLKPFRFTHLQKSGGGSPHLATVAIPLALRHEGSEPAIFVGGEGSQRSESREPRPVNHKSPVTNHESLRLTPLTSTLTNFASASPLDSALTSKRAAKPFTCNTYEKHTQGEGGLVAQAEPVLSTVEGACDFTRFGWLALNVLGKGHQSRVTNRQSPVSSGSLTLLVNPAIKLALPFVFARLCTLPEESCMRRPTED